MGKTRSWEPMGRFYLTPSTNVQGWLSHSFTQGEGGDDLPTGFPGRGLPICGRFSRSTSR